MICNPANPKESGPVDIWQETFPVRFGSIDKSDRLTLDAVFQFFQEAAISHAENLEAGREALIASGRLWILSRMSVLVNRRPDYGEIITVRTWPQGSEKLFAIRNYDIRNSDGIPLVSARSAWLIVDMEKRRPLRPQTVVDKLPPNEGLEPFSFEAEALAAIGLAERGNLQKTAERKALYTDIDYNRHVNNVSYIKWIEDTLDPRLLEETNKMRFDINYLNEILSGECAEIFCAEIDGINGAAFPGKAFAFEGRKAETGQAAFRAELRLFNSFSEELFRN